MTLTFHDRDERSASLNQLTTDFKKPQSTSSFKRNLKLYMFTAANSDCILLLILCYILGRPVGGVSLSLLVEGQLFKQFFTRATLC